MAWVFASLGLLLLAGAGAAVYFQNSSPSAQESVAESTSDASSGFKLPEIVVAEEKSDPSLYDPNIGRATADDYHFLAEAGDEVEDAPSAPKPAAGKAGAKGSTNADAEAEGPVTAGVKREFIAHKTPGIEGVPEDRVVDILCIYTTQYKVRYGKGNSKLIVKRITDMVKESNAIWQKQNGKTVAVRIVGVVETPYLDEYQTVDLDKLNRNQIPTISGAPAHQLRKKLGADMVALFGTKGGGGVSTGNPFFVVKRGHGIFTHECQHAFGWGHKEQLPAGGDDVSKLGQTAPGRAAWMPRSVPAGKIWVEYKGR